MRLLEKTRCLTSKSIKWFDRARKRDCTGVCVVFRKCGHTKGSSIWLEFPTDDKERSWSRGGEERERTVRLKSVCDQILKGKNNGVRHFIRKPFNLS